MHACDRYWGSEKSCLYYSLPFAIRLCFYFPSARTPPPPFHPCPHPFHNGALKLPPHPPPSTLSFLFCFLHLFTETTCLYLSYSLLDCFILGFWEEKNTQYTHTHTCWGAWSVYNFLWLFPSRCWTFFFKGLHCALHHKSCSVLWQEKCCAVLNVIKHAPLPWSPDIERLVEEGLKIQHPLWVGLGVWPVLCWVCHVV